MNFSQIIAIQAKIGTTQDGQWGSKSDAACRAYLRGLMPDPSPWPDSSDAAMRAFYGEPGDEENLVKLSVLGTTVQYDGTPVMHVRCHKRVADSLGRVLHAISVSPQRDILKRYAGCYNFRTMRNSTRTSKHAWGAAIDIDPDVNGLHTHWPRMATMPFAVMEAFAREGWVGLGWSANRDAMHFQATR
jgi:hypothetical protein